MADRQRRELEGIERLAQAEIEAFLKRSSLTYLECCISLMLTHLPRDEVAKILNDEAEMLRDLY